MEELLPFIAAAKDLYDVVSGLYKLVRKADSTLKVSAGLKGSLCGNPSKAHEVSARLSQMLSKKAVPFILRLGNNFKLPADITKMEAAILAKDVWDWTYVFGWKAHHRMEVGTVEYLRKLYCDPLDNSLARPDAATTCLQLFSSDPDEEFGESFCVAGVALTSSSYEQVFDIPKEDLLPNVVIRIDQGINAYTDPVAMNFMMSRAVDCIFHTFRSEAGTALGFLYREEPGDKSRKLSEELRIALRI